MESTQKIVFWFGAGVSIPSHMPGGEALTWHWLEHHLPVTHEMALLHQLYREAHQSLGKTMPRLEKVIEDCLWAMGPDCLANLEIFHHCAPNWIHHQIAEIILRTQSWAITTNFDQAVEAAAGHCIPVITPSQHPLSNWGLLKLHGSIEEPLPTLGHSISNLEPGLPPSLRDALLALLDDPDVTLIVLGYSGSDYFDITPLFSQRIHQGKLFAAHLCWLAWQNDLDNRTQEEQLADLPEGARTFCAAFAPEHRQILGGPTEHTLARALKRAPFIINQPSAAFDWKKGWKERYTPTLAQRQRFAAKWYASMGCGAHSLRWLAPSAWAPGSLAGKDARLALNALRDQGWYEAEYRLRQQLVPDNTAADRRQWQRMHAASLRLSGRWRRAAWQYCRMLWQPAVQPAHAKALQREQQAGWMEAGIFFQSAAIHLLQKPAPYDLWSCIQVWLCRLAIRHSLVRVDARHEAPALQDAHMRAAMMRLICFMHTPMPRLVAWLERNRSWQDIWPPPPAQARDHAYRETDSFLGTVNNLRNIAQEITAAWQTQGLHPHDAAITPPVSVVVRLLQDSLQLARQIGDSPGQCKAARALAKLTTENAESLEALAQQVECAQYAQEQDFMHKYQLNVSLTARIRHKIRTAAIRLHWR